MLPLPVVDQSRQVDLDLMVDGFFRLVLANGSVKVVQARLRHASATTTLNTYAHLWPGADESTRAAVGAMLTARNEDRKQAR